MKHHGIVYCCHCTTVPAVKFGLCWEHIAQLRAAVTAADVARIAVRHAPDAVACKACSDAADPEYGLCLGCRCRIAA